jgi:hypothetical protein
MLVVCKLNPYLIGRCDSIRLSFKVVFTLKKTSIAALGGLIRGWIGRSSARLKGSLNAPKCLIIGHVIWVLNELQKDLI